MHLKRKFLNFSEDYAAITRIIMATTYLFFGIYSIYNLKTL